MDSFWVKFKRILLYFLLLGCEFQVLKGVYTLAAGAKDAQIPENEEEYILNYHKSDNENINSEEMALSELFPGISLPQSNATTSTAGFVDSSFSANTPESTASEYEKTSNQRISPSGEENPIDSNLFVQSVKSKSDNYLLSVKASSNPPSNTQEDSIFQWSLDNDQATEAVYYSEYTDHSSKLLLDDKFRELRSIADEDLQSFAEMSSMFSTKIPVIHSMDFNQPSPVIEKPITNSTTFNKSITDSIMPLPSHSKNTGIDDIINGLVHLLGDNVKVANSTDTESSMSESQSIISMRINNRGPPTSVSLLSDDMLFTSLPYDIDEVKSDTRANSSNIEIFIPLTTSKLISQSKSTSNELQSSINGNSMVTISLSSEITSSIPILSEIASTTEDSTPPATSVRDEMEVALTYPKTTFEITQQQLSTSETKIDSTPMRTQSSIETKFNGFTSAEEFLPTQPIGGWRPVQPFRPTNPQLPIIPTRTGQTKVSLPSQSKIPTIHEQLIPSFQETTERNKFSSAGDTSLLEDVSLITANEELLGDILLTATGAMNGGGAPKPIPIPTPIKATIIDETITNDQSVYIDGRRQYFTLQNPEDSEGEVKSGIVDTQPRPRPQPIKPSVSTQTKPSIPRPKQTSTIRIDTCIVGDDTACDSKNHEVCRTEGGVSSCTCPPGLARAKNSNECIGVVSLLLYLRIDHLNGQRIAFDEVYNTDSPEKDYMKSEAVLGISSLFRMSSLAPIFIDLHFNSFYAIGGKLATNVTIMIQESPHTTTQLIKQVISRELISTLQQKNHSLGKSHLSVDSRFNPIPSIQDLNECADDEWNDCSVNGDCENTFGSFRCSCWPGFTDKFSNDAVKRGRVCTACSSEYCNNHGICILNEGKQECRCRGSYIGHKCEIDSEVLGVALGASLAALLIIILTFICLCMWSRRWKKDHQKPQIHCASPSFTYMDKIGKGQCDLHSLVSDNTLQWFPMRERDTRSNFYSLEPPEMARNPLALVPIHPPYPTMIRSNNLSHSQTKLMGSDDCLNDNQTTRFYVPRPKARLRSEYQNIYSDPIHDEDLANSSRGHRQYDGQSVHNFFN